MNMKNKFVLLILSSQLLCLGNAQALTIYRIGGEGLPQPDIAGDFEFIQMPWEDLEVSKQGSSELLEVTSGSLIPLQLDPTENLVTSMRNNGGRILNLTWIGWGPAADDDLFIFDEDNNTVYLGDGHFASHGPDAKSLTFDFGARLLLEKIKFYPREKHLTDRFVQRFKIGMNDGDPLKEGTREYVIGQRGSDLDFDIVYDITENTDSVIELDLPKVPIQKLLFSAKENTRGIWELAELEIYGKGYAPFSNYVSNVIDLGALASLGQISWSGSVEDSSKVDLTMRSGLDEDPNLYWRSTFRGGERTRFDSRGRALTYSTYSKLKGGEKAGMTHDTENWAFWSASYDFASSEGRMSGDGPQRYLQFRADIQSNGMDKAALDYVQFAVSIPPVASEAKAEITPTSVAPGQIQSFTYKIRPNLKSDDLGFDTIEIDTPARATSVDAVRISGLAVEFEDKIAQDHFSVSIPRIDVQRTGELIEVDFRAEVFQFGTVFSSRIRDGQRPLEVPQSIVEGNADQLDDSDRISVDLNQFGMETINTLHLDRRIFTPNGDNINDTVEIEFDLLNLSGAVPVKAELYDLSGQSLGGFWSGVSGSGRFSVTWDGKLNGSRLPPGLYLVQISVEADRGLDIRQVALSVAY
jgi:hypothetical protein